MSHHIAIVQGHPDPAGGHLCHVLANAYAEGAQEGNHQVSRIEIAGLDFPLLRSIVDSDLPDVLVGPMTALLAANHIVVIFPFGLRFMPVPIKAFFQQIMRPRMAFRYKKGPPSKLFKGRSARIIVTMGVPVLFYRFYSFVAPDDIKQLKRDMSGVGIAPVHESLFGMVEVADTRKWLRQMRELGAKAL